MATSETKPGRKKRRGKPFAPGNTAGAATRWRKGDPSPNPGGRPAGADGFRDDCRRGAARLRVRLVKLAGQGGPFVDVGSLVRAFEALADRGGYLPADRQANVLLKALESPALKDQDRKAVLGELLGRPVDGEDGEP